MAGMIGTNDSVYLERIIQNVRNILWLNLLLEQLKYAFTIVSIFILSAGLIHVFFISVSLQSLSILIAATILLNVFYSFKKMPSLLEAAISIDERLSSGTLITSAFELVHNNHSSILSEFSPWVVRQAVQLVSSHRASVRSLLLKIPAPPWFALIISMMGLFFIVQPEKSTRLQSGVRQTALLNENITSSKHADNALIDAVRRELVDLSDRKDAASIALNKDFLAPVQDKGSSFSDRGQKPDADEDDVAYRDDSSAPGAAGSRTKSDLMQPGPLRSSDRGLGTGKDTHAESTRYKQVPFKARHYIDIKLEDGNPVNDDEQTVPFHPQQLSDQYRSIRFASEFAESRQSTVWNPSFTFSQHNYIGTYFKELRSK